MRKIASNPDNRFDWWIMKTFNVLPTDPRFQDMTDEQREFLWENFLIDNPEIEKKLKNRFHDPEFDKEWDKLDEASQEGAEDVSETEEGIYDQDDYEELEASYASFIEGNTDMQLPDYKEVLKAKGVNVDDNDWEEVD